MIWSGKYVCSKVIKTRAKRFTKTETEYVLRIMKNLGYVKGESNRNTHAIDEFEMRIRDSSMEHDCHET